MLDEFFTQTVASGWRPRNPCMDERELAQLVQSQVRGDCIAPLLVAGDTIYIDTDARPLPGDVVSFPLSRRFCDAQNSDLPPGQSPWHAGARWCKLFGEYHGIPMLFDRHGSSTSATLAVLEDPDGDPLPLLHPVRQIRRRGRLLFAPDTEAGQMGQNAATSTYTAAYDGGSSFGGLSATVVPLGYSLDTPGVTDPTFTAIYTVTVSGSLSSAGTAELQVGMRNSDGSNGWTWSTVQYPLDTTPTQLTMQWEFALPSTGKGQQFDVGISGTATSGSTGQAVAQVEYIKR